MADNITFYEGTSSQYNSATKDSNGVYFIFDSGDKIGKIYKGNELYTGSELEIASGSVLGGIKVGSDFDIAEDGTLSLYVPMKINSFSNDKPNNEIGSTVSNATFSWNLNKVPTQLTITSGNLSQTLSNSKVSNTLLQFTNGITSNTTFTLQATDSRNNPITATSSINFLHRKYYGVSTVSSANNIDNKFVLGLSSALASNCTGSFTVNAGTGQYIFAAYPVSFGTPIFYVGGFEGGFSLIKTFDFTNASGNTTSYNVYKSTNANLGNTTVEVK